jgi:transposase-like protein
MKAMAKHRTHSIEFKRQIAQDFIAGETLHALASRHDISRNLIRIWVRKFEAGASPMRLIRNYVDILGISRRASAKLICARHFLFM